MGSSIPGRRPADQAKLCAVRIALSEYVGVSGRSDGDDDVCGGN